MSKRQIQLGVIGCGLMGREFASAVGRWRHLLNLDFEPKIVAAANATPAALDWFEESVPTLRLKATHYEDLLADAQIEAIYCAVPHHLHARIYEDIIRAGKHLLGEKPFGIDLPANQEIMETIRQNPGGLVRCSSEFPFYPAAYQISRWIREDRFGTILDVDAGFWHSSDLNPLKPINWKRMIATNGAYGCLGDLGFHVVHIPFRAGWFPQNVRAILSQIVRERPNKAGQIVACETWDNAHLTCEVKTTRTALPVNFDHP
jgi:predicted dehydrogenase